MVNVLILLDPSVLYIRRYTPTKNSFNSNFSSLLQSMKDFSIISLFSLLTLIKSVEVFYDILLILDIL